MKVGGQCGYVDILEDGVDPCVNMGLRFVVKDELGHYHSIVRCIEHSDWVQAAEVQP